MKEKNAFGVWIAISVLCLLSGCAFDYRSVSPSVGSKLILKSEAMNLGNDLELEIQLFSYLGDCSNIRGLGGVKLTQGSSEKVVWVKADERIYIKAAVWQTPFRLAGVNFDRAGSLYLSFFPEKGKEYTLEYKEIPNDDFVVIANENGKPLVLQSWSACQSPEKGTEFNIGNIVKSMGAKK